MKILHLMAGGGIGGIERLMLDYVKYSKHENVFVFVWTEGEIAENIRKIGIATYFLNGFEIGNLKIIKKLNVICESEKPDILLVHHEAPLLRFYGALHNKKFPFYFYVHSDAKDNVKCNNILKHWILTAINQFSAKRAKKIIAISNYVKESIVNVFKVSEEKIEVVYNGVDIDCFFNKPNVPQETVHMISVGRLVEAKGVQVTLKALAKLPENVSWDFTVVGDGNYRNTLEMLTQSLGIGDKVQFTGTQNDIPSYLKKADILIHACLCDEGFGIAIVEAMSSGKLCICSRSGAIPELIEDGVNGFMFEKGNDDLLSNILQKVINEKNDWNKIQTSAQKKAGQFHIRIFASKLDSVLEE